MTFRAALKWWIPGYRTHKRRLPLYLKWLTQQIRADEVRKPYPSDEERDWAIEQRVQSMLADIQAYGLKDYQAIWFFQVRDGIVDWRRANRLLQRKEANKSRWIKEKMRKQP